jgi:hypothetical protein
VRYTSGEETVEYVQRSRWVLVGREALPGLISLLVLLITFLVPSTGPLSRGLWVLWMNLLYVSVPALAIWMFLVWLDYADDVYILTTKRIIEVERSFWVFPKQRRDIEYKNIKETKLKVPGLIGIVLNIGHVSVEAQGTKSAIVFSYVGDPYRIQNRIEEIKSHDERVKKIKDENERKEQLHLWFAKVFEYVENKEEPTSEVPTSKVPDLKGKDFPTALVEAEEGELEVAIFGEAVESGEVAPGCVLWQNPLPGTIMVKGSTIEVVLCKRPSLVEEF